MKVEVRLEGICLLVKSAGHQQPSPAGPVTIMLPVSQPTTADGTPVPRHSPTLLIPEANLKNPAPSSVQLDGVGYGVFPVVNADIRFNQPPTTAGATPNRTQGFESIIKVRDLMHGAKLHQDLVPLHAQDAITKDPSNWITARFRVSGGHFETEDTPKQCAKWLFDTHPPTHPGPAKKDGYVWNGYWVASLPDAFTIELRPFDGSVSTSIEVVANGSAAIRIWLGNECLDPKDWLNPEARCSAPQPVGKPVDDIDFAIYYNLMQGVPGSWPASKKLPIPHITVLCKEADLKTMDFENAIIMAGSEWCELGLIEEP